jgi:glycerophosphoryl diester phosphodiesterase
MVVAHRGYHQREPENTLAAFAEALAMGVDGIEVDVRLSGDGQLVCFHDPYLKRLTGVSGRIARTATPKLLQLPLRHPTSRHQGPVATLPEVLSLVEDRVHIILDLKKESVRPTELEQKTITALREAGLRDNITISSFNPWVIKRVKQIAPDYTTALIASSRLGVRLYDSMYSNGIHIHYELLRRRWFRRIEQQFRRIMVWTVDRKSDVDFPLAENIGGIITNRPERWGAEGAPRKRLTLRSAEQAE